MALWTVSTYHKKSCQEVEQWARREGEGQITVTNGYRFGKWSVETSDDNLPEFEFTEVAGIDDGRKDGIDMLNCEINNIESVEVIELFDGGCWYDIIFDEVTDDEEIDLQEFINENSIYDLEYRDNDEWYHQETEHWVWGPIKIQNQDGETVRIIIADADGNTVDYIEK